MTPVPADRTCKSAAIPDQFCSCHLLVDVNATSAVAFNAGKALVAEINAALSGVTDLCRIWALNRVVRVRKRDKEEEYSILVQTDPKAVFQGWVNMRAERGFRVSLNQVSRMDVC